MGLFASRTAPLSDNHRKKEVEPAESGLGGIMAFLYISVALLYCVTASVNFAYSRPISGYSYLLWGLGSLVGAFAM